MSSASSRGLAVRRSGGALLLLAALAGGCSSTEGGHPRRVERGNAVQERLLLEETLEAYERAENSGQVGDLLLLFTEQISLLLPGEEPVRGAMAVGQRYLEWIEEGRTAVDVQLLELTHDGQLGLAQGRLVGSTRDRGGQRRRFDSQFLMALERVSTGWRISHLVLLPAGSAG